MTRGLYEQVKELLDMGADPNARNGKGQTALMIAASLERSLCLQVLIEKADLDAKDPLGKTAVMMAAVAGSDASLRALVKAGANVNVTTPRGQTVLILAAAEGSVQGVKTLADLGAYLNIQDSEGKTALITAACKGDARCLEVLISAGADLNIKDYEGKTALLRVSHLKIINGEIKKLKENKDEFFPRHFRHPASFSGYYKQVIMIHPRFLEFQLEFPENHEECVKLLCEAGADMKFTKTVQICGKLEDATGTVREVIRGTRIETTALLMALEAQCAGCVKVMGQQEALKWRLEQQTNRRH